jgi:hypothetical protein
MKRIFLVLFTLTCVFAAYSQSTDGTHTIVKSTTTNNGGGTSSDGTLSVTGTIGQVDAVESLNDGQLKIFGGFWTIEPLAPTAANALISGRIKTANGRGIRNVVITLSDTSTGETRRILSSPFGYYRFQNVEVGKTYILEVNSKRFSFNPNNRVIAPSEDLTDEDFTAENAK